MVAGVLDGQPLDSVGTEDIAGILNLMEYLIMDEDSENKCCAAMARKTAETHREQAERRRSGFAGRALASYYRYILRKAGRRQGGTGRSVEEFTKRVLAGLCGTDSRGIKVYALQLLRECAGRHGMCMAINDERATLCTTRYRRRHRECGSADKVGAIREMWVVGDRGLGTYRWRPEMLGLLRMVADIMDVRRIDVVVVRWSPKDTGVVEEIRSMGRPGTQEISCRGFGSGAIHEHLQRYKEPIRPKDCLEELDVFQNKELGGTGGHERTEKAEHLPLQDGARNDITAFSGAEELDISWSDLSDEDWRAVGKMAALKSLNATYRDIDPGMVSKHLQELKSHLEQPERRGLADSRGDGDAPKPEYLFLQGGARDDIAAFPEAEEPPGGTGYDLEQSERSGLADSRANDNTQKTCDMVLRDGLKSKVKVY
ncbi:UNVERIFIED_CONTAM: hypothetical protein PYX00_011553 [Menopon gallinae]|uniref:Uncharacterized protein n=1 Tax=Menopon gallinae TaxID=328185 RepID=A0AAW2H7U9_9NEOP